MRKLLPTLAATLALAFVAMVPVPAANAGTVSLSLNKVTPSTTTFTISGVYASNVPTVSGLSAPNESYSFTFTLLTNPSSLSSFSADPGGAFFDVDATFFLSLNGGSAVQVGSTPFTVEFDTFDTAEQDFGGLNFCFNTDCTVTNASGWNLLGQQLFTGSVSNPAFISTPNAQINQTQSTYFVDGSNSFPFGTAPTPEPTSILLLGTGLLGLGIIVRRKFRV